MLVWTFQPIGTCSKLHNGISFRTNKSKVDAGFTDAYTWLSRQMEEMIGTKPTGVTFPVWAWYSYDGEHKKPDLRRSFFRGTKNCELLELEIPDSEIVLSDFDSWHFVLNDMWIDNSTNETEWESNHKWYDSLPADERHDLKLASWMKIFDTTIVDTAWVKQGFFVQATFWEIKPEYLISCKTINSKPNLALTDDEKIDVVAKEVLDKYLPAFKELAK